MPTTVTKSIGSGGGRDYSTPQAWEDALPANLVTGDTLQVGECYNDSEFLVTTDATAVLFISGQTTDSTRYIHLTAAAGQSFQDNVNVRTNALRYNAANGVGFRIAADVCGIVLRVGTQFTRVSRLQLKSTPGVGPSFVIYTDINNIFLKDILSHQDGNSVGVVLFHTADVINVVSVMANTGNNAFDGLGAGGGFQNDLIACSAIRPSDRSAAATAFANASADGQRLVDCCSFGFTTVATNAAGTGSSNNATDQASGMPGSSNQHSVTYSQTTPFVDADKDSLDLRAIASTSLAGNGVLDSTNAPLDISGTTRPSGPTIGVWQLVAAAAAGPSYIAPFRWR